MGWSKQFVSSLVAPACTRPLLESRVRARVAAHPRVRFWEGCDVVGLLAGPAGAVKGVRVRRRGEAETDTPDEELTADLVVDAGGRTARTIPWLKELGYPTPQERVINGFVGYATAMYQPPADFQATWKGLYIQAAPPTHLRGAVIWPVEGGRWIITLAGMGRDYPPTDEAEFVRYAQSLRTPMVYDALRQARRLTPITGYRATENRLRHYERMPAWPAGFVVLGDAACAFNPVYGQGMSVAAMSAQVLDACLEERQPGDFTSQWGKLFQQRLARSNADVWRLATGADLRGPATEGDKPGPLDRLMYRYLDRVFLRATVDAEVALTVAEVLHLRQPASALMRPRILLPTLRGV